MAATISVAALRTRPRNIVIAADTIGPPREQRRLGSARGIFLALAFLSGAERAKIEL
jgi:hypothetical protein